VGQLGQLLTGDTDLEAVGIFRLGGERADDGDEVGVAAALADAVERALDLADKIGRASCRERVS
jgi:hypothetical protein